MKINTLLLASILLFSGLVVSAKSEDVVLDFNDVLGPVKPVNSVGQPPLLGLSNASMFHYLSEAGVTYSRLHDVGGSFADGVFVDIPNIFRNFDADENDPASYDFVFTDLLIKNIVDSGIEPYYRLGVTIENDCAIKAYRIFPPEDYGKWARICEHIILHYNYGWAEGFSYGITHWEIWNEPENYENPMENQMWRGTFEQYLEFYGFVAPYLKSRFPELMIGGYASTGFKAITKDFKTHVPSDVSRREYFLSCFKRFLESAREKNWPLDFFSFHSYSAVPYLKAQIDYVRRTLDEYGFRDTQMSLNEWLPKPGKEKLGTSMQAAEIASGLAIFQYGPVDDAELYDARARGGAYSPLFWPEINQPRKAYYSLKMFGELKGLGTAVRMPQLPDGVYGCAATDTKGHAALMIANISSKKWRNNIRWPGYSVESVAVIDDGSDMSDSSKSRAKVIVPGSVILIRLIKND